MKNFDYKSLDNISLMELFENIKSELNRRENKITFNVGDCFYYKNDYYELIIHYITNIKNNLIYLNVLSISDDGTMDLYSRPEHVQNYVRFISDKNEIDKSVYFSIRELYDNLCETQKQLEKETAIEALQLFNTLTK